MTYDNDDAGTRPKSDANAADEVRQNFTLAIQTGLWASIEPLSESVVCGTGRHVASMNGGGAAQ